MTCKGLESSPHAAQLQVAAAIAGGAAGARPDRGADGERLHQDTHLCEEQGLIPSPA